MNYRTLAEAATPHQLQQLPLAQLIQAFSYRENYLDENSLYVLYFKYLPNRLVLSDIDCRKGLDWCMEHFKADIKHSYYSEHHNKEYTRTEANDVYLFLKKDVLVSFNFNTKELILLFKETPRQMVEALAQGFLNFKNIRKAESKIGLLTSSYGDLHVTFIDIEDLDTELSLFYNDDFLPIHKRISERLMEQDAKGLVLLHGIPGTGKTSYIRYLIRKLDKEVIFIPPNMAYALTNPDFIKLMAEHKNSVLVIEDAELLLKDRTAEGVSPVSGLLNLTDGLLSDCLHLQIICTFNIPLHKIDPALLRKGRLLARYEFKELEPHKANALSKHLGFKACFEKATPLTDVVNQDEPAFVQKEPAGVGFK